MTRGGGAGSLARPADRTDGLRVTPEPSLPDAAAEAGPRAWDGDLPDDLPADRVQAWVHAHVALERLQLSRAAAPSREQLGRWARRAAAAGWTEVHVQLLDCVLLDELHSGAPAAEVQRHADALVAAALHGDDEVLLARAIASRVQTLTAAAGTGAGRGPAAEDHTGDLARAVAMLDDAFRAGPAVLGRSAAELPAGYVECGIAFYRLDLWELEAEMYDRAGRACALPFGPAERQVADLTRRVLPFNRQESDCMVVCALLEVGRDDAARDLARRRPGRSWLDGVALPTPWVAEVRAQEHLLGVVAAGPDVPAGHCDIPEELYEELGRGAWNGCRGLLHLAAALARRAHGDLTGAVEQAELAVDRLDAFGPAARNLALALATLGSPKSAAHRYAAHLADLRWDARLQVLAAARSRLAAARTVRDGEALRRALVADDLTGLGNRRAWSEQLDRVRTAPKDARVAVVVVDLDRFKAVNDSFGHAAGDDVLRAVGGLLRGAVRTTDVAVRLGGDEFALLAVVEGEEDLAERAGGIVDAVREQPWHLVAPGLRVTASAGHASGPAGAVDAVLALADRRLYAAKAAGRDRVASTD